MNKRKTGKMRKRRRNMKLRRLKKKCLQLLQMLLFAVLIFGIGSYLVSRLSGGWRLPWSIVSADIVLDAGHGGKDQGAGDANAPEKQINLEVAHKVREILKESGYRVAMTRKGDTFVELSERAAFANRKRARVFVSVHCNSAEVAAEGIETFYGKEKDDGSDILAGMIQTRLIEETDAKDRDIKEAGYTVIVRTQMPSALVEVGFLNNEKERQLLMTEDYQEKLAKGIAEGIIEYLEEAEE